MSENCVDEIIRLIETDVAKVRNRRGNATTPQERITVTIIRY